MVTAGNGYLTVLDGLGNVVAQIEAEYEAREEDETFPLLEVGATDLLRLRKDYWERVRS